MVVVNGYQPWLERIFSICIDPGPSSRQQFHREAVLADSLQFPESTYRRYKKKNFLPWTFIVENINIPDVYEWSFQARPEPDWSKDSPVDDYRFRLGVWTCAQYAYVHNQDIPVTMIFTQPKDVYEEQRLKGREDDDINTNVSEDIITKKLFPYLYDKDDYNIKRKDEEYVACWFFWLFRLVTDWDNVISEFEGHLRDADRDSEREHLPVKHRTRAMHHQIDRIYELLLYLSSHTRCVKKLSRQNPNKQSNKTGNDGDSSDAGGGASIIERGDEPIWDELEDLEDDLDQADYELSALKDRFENLTDLEFNLSNAKQSDDSRFLSGIATLFLPISFLASVWGFTTIQLTPEQYTYAAVPALVVSALFITIYPRFTRWYQKKRFPEKETWLEMYPEEYTMIGQELPSNVGGLRANNSNKSTKRRPGVNRSRSRRRTMDDKDQAWDRR